MHNTKCHILNVPSSVLDDILRATLDVCEPSSRSTLVSSLGSTMHTSALRVLYHTLSFTDDVNAFDVSHHEQRLYGSTRPSQLETVLRHPERYGSFVRKVVVREQGRVDAPHGDANAEPAETAHLLRVVEVCPDVEEVIWESRYIPPDGFCEMLSRHFHRFSKFVHGRPPFVTSNASVLDKWDALSLPSLAGSPLTSLHLSRLSQAGAHALADLLESLAEESTLEDLDLSFVWLGDALCERIAGAGGRLRKLRLSTSGTKLTDKGIISVMEGCDMLESFELDEVQGRMSRSVWEKPLHYPTNLRSLCIFVAEQGPHHSWAIDHLTSLAAFPIEQLETLRIVRREGLPSLVNGVFSYDTPVDDIVSLRSLPAGLNQKLCQAKRLKRLECDFWMWIISDIKSAVETCSELKVLRLCLDAPLSKLLALGSTFALLPKLERLHISVNPLHAPGRPPVPLLPLEPVALPTPSSSPKMESHFKFSSQDSTQAIEIVDPSFPHVRDVKRFVRKCNALSVFEWYGKEGRGTWAISRVPSGTKTNLNVAVEYTPPTLQVALWREVQGRMQNGGEPVRVRRKGHMWRDDDLSESAITIRESERRTPSKPTKEGKSTRKRGLLTLDMSYNRRPAKSMAAAEGLITPPHSDTSIPEESTSPMEYFSPQGQNFGSRGQKGRIRSPSIPETSVSITQGHRARARSSAARSAGEIGCAIQSEKGGVGPDSSVFAQNQVENGTVAGGIGRGGKRGNGRPLRRRSEANTYDRSDDGNLKRRRGRGGALLG